MPPDTKQRFAELGMTTRQLLLPKNSMPISSRRSPNGRKVIKDANIQPHGLSRLHSLLPGIPAKTVGVARQPRHGAKEAEFTS